MPRSKNTPRDKTAESLQLVINFGDDATQWFQNLSAAVSARPKEIEVQFVGGSIAPPYEIIALRNALLGIPRSIRLVTTTLVSLPPLTCAAWLVGDERRIARDAVIWIPELPEDILRNGLRRHYQASSEGSNTFAGAGEAVRALEDAPESENDAEEAEDSVPFGRPGGHLGSEAGAGEEGFGGAAPMRRSRSDLRRQRCELDLRALADVLNEWFPSWEFNGSCLTFDDLVVWDVVKPEWCFGGRGVRHRPEAPSKKGRTRAIVTQSRAFVESGNCGEVDTQAPLNRGKAAFDVQKLEQDADGEQAPNKDESNVSGAESEPQIAAKPSDL